MKNILKIFLALALAVCARAEQSTVLVDSTTGALTRPSAATFKSANGLSSTTGASLLYGNGSGGFSNATVGSGLSFSGGTLTATGSGTGDVTAASNFGTDNVIIRSDGTSKGVQSTGISIDDSNNITGIAGITATTLTFTNLSGTVPVANGGTGITSFGTGIATWLDTPSSANLRAALTDETGTGAAVFAAGPIFSGSVGIGSSSPQQQLHVAGTSNVNALVEQVSADTNSAGFLAVKARGTPASPDYPSAADNLFTLGGGGWNGSTLYTYNAALIAMRAYNTWSGSDNSTDIVFSTTPLGSTTRGDVFIMSNASIKAYSPIISTPAVRTTLALPYFTINIPADTGITAATEGPGFKTVTATRTWATTGTVALQRENFFAGPTYASASASQTFTDAFTLYATPPIAGTNAIFTRGHTLGIVDSTSASSSITGAVVVSAALGTTATSVGIGGGNINAGGNGTFGGTLNVTGVITGISTTQSAGDNSTKLATTAYADAGSKAASVSTYASPDTTGGAVTLTNAVTEVWTNTTTTYALPAVASSAGKAVIFYVVGTNVVTIDPNASEIIVRDGTPQTGGVTMTLTGAAGNYVCMVCEGGRWITLGYKGTLAAGS